MTAVQAWAPARVGLAGNPSDGYGGATVSLAIANFGTRATVADAERLEIRSGPRGLSSFASLGTLVEEVRRGGYGDPPRLLRAALVRFWDLARSRGVDLSDAKVAIGYETTVPAEVGLAGSSAIVVAALLALCDRFGIAVERQELPPIALAVETEELGVAAGPQDRVVQVLGGLVYMDFNPARRHPRYEALRPRALPPLLVAWDPDAGVASGFVHSVLRRRFDSGEPAVVRAISALAAHAGRAREAIVAGDADALARAMDASFELRRSLIELDPRHVRLMELARAHGCAANYAGSGGAIAALCPDERRASELEQTYTEGGLGCEPCRPAPGAGIVTPGGC